MIKTTQVTIELTDKEIKDMLKERLRQKVQEVNPEYKGHCEFLISADVDDCGGVISVSTQVSYKIETEIA